MGVKSPCTKNCSLYSDICVSCFRTKQEIGLWSSMSDNEKQAVLDRINADLAEWLKAPVL